MILGLDDITGGREIVGFFVWLGLTFLFYLVGYVAALNVIDDLTKNRWIKIPIMWGIAFVTSGLMSILNYNPLILFFVMLVANYFRLKNLTLSNNEKFENSAPGKAIFYIASYGYILLVLGITHYIDFRNSS
jgi:ABC-type polysaccharide/polyol phosphate export permease